MSFWYASCVRTKIKCRAVAQALERSAVLSPSDLHIAALSGWRWLAVPARGSGGSALWVQGTVKGAEHAVPAQALMPACSRDLPWRGVLECGINSRCGLRGRRLAAPLDVL